MKSYIIKNSNDINDGVVGIVDAWPWEEYTSPLRVEFRIVHTDECFKFALRCYEKEPYAGMKNTNGYVCNDSCMELFLSPSADNSAGYFNFEVNANPTYLFGYNKGVRVGSVFVEWDESEYELTSSKGRDEVGDFWQINATLPYALIKKYVPSCDLSSGGHIRGNVYKCGRHHQPEHYGCWSPVVSDEPNFHAPEFFGEFVIE